MNPRLIKHLILRTFAIFPLKRVPHHHLISTHLLPQNIPAAIQHHRLLTLDPLQLILHPFGTLLLLDLRRWFRINPRVKKCLLRSIVVDPQNIPLRERTTKRWLNWWRTSILFIFFMDQFDHYLWRFEYDLSMVRWKCVFWGQGWFVSSMTWFFVGV